MFRSTILEIFDSVWPMLLIITVILSSLRLVWLYKNKQKFIFYKEMMLLGFIIYIMCLFYVVTFQDVNWSSSNFIPFREMFRYEFGSRLFLRNVVGNMIMFLPYGFFITYFLKLTKNRTAFFLCFLVSCTIEVTQLLIGRVFDIDDIMLNLLGGMMGNWFCRSIAEIRNHLPNFLKKEWIYNIIMAVIVVFMALYLFNVILVGV